MDVTEFSNQFDVLYNNITSNQAPGLNEYEKSVFLTKAQNEIVKNYFTANSKGNNIGQGFDDSAKRQADFSGLMGVYHSNTSAALSSGAIRMDNRSLVYNFPTDVFIVINESLEHTTGTDPNTKTDIYQVIPIRYDEYMRLMSKPYKRPLKNQVWRLINKATVSGNTITKKAELITGPEINGSTTNLTYIVRYIRYPKPIILGDLDGLTIEGHPTESEASTVFNCELDPILHEDILQRAVELAKVAWTATGQDNTQAVLAAGQRSE